MALKKCRPRGNRIEIIYIQNYFPLDRARFKHYSVEWLDDEWINFFFLYLPLFNFPYASLKIDTAWGWRKIHDLREIWLSIRFQKFFVNSYSFFTITMFRFHVFSIILTPMFRYYKATVSFVFKLLRALLRNTSSMLFKRPLSSALKAVRNFWWKII